MVCDILGDSWPCDLRTASMEECLRVLKNNTNCNFFIDESGMSIGRGKGADYAQWLATQSRHWGHKGHFIVQHYSFLDLKIRSQCDEFLIFNCSQKSATAIADEIGEPLAAEASKLGQYEAFYLRPFQPKIRIKLDSKNRVKILQRY